MAIEENINSIQQNYIIFNNVIDNYIKNINEIIDIQSRQKNILFLFNLPEIDPKSYNTSNDDSNVCDIFKYLKLQTQPECIYNSG